MNQKHKESIYHANVNVNFLIENIIQNKSGKIINIDVSVKNIIYVKKIMFGILLHVVVKLVDIEQILRMIQGLGVM